MDIDIEMQHAIDTMEQQWESGTFPGWPVGFFNLLYALCNTLKYTKITICFLERSWVGPSKRWCSFRTVGFFKLGRTGLTRSR